MSVATCERTFKTSSKEVYEDLRIQVFEEYANAGFEILQAELAGAVDYADQVLLVLLKERQGQPVDEFDLTKFLQT